MRSFSLPPQNAEAAACRSDGGCGVAQRARERSGAMARWWGHWPRSSLSLRTPRFTAPSGASLSRLSWTPPLTCTALALRRPHPGHPVWPLRRSNLSPWLKRKGAQNRVRSLQQCLLRELPDGQEMTGKGLTSGTSPLPPEFQSTGSALRSEDTWT